MENIDPVIGGQSVEPVYHFLGSEIMGEIGNKWEIDKLNGTNWTTWKFQMKHLLLARDLWGVVDGSEPVPDPATDAIGYGKYQQKLQKALANIVLGISTSQLYLVTSCETPKDAWSALRDHFERDSLANKIMLKKQYFRMEMKEGTSVEDHLKKMKELTDKLAAVGSPISEEDQVVTLLGSLPSSYSALVTALEARSDDISLAYVQQALVHEELKRDGCQRPASWDSALVGAHIRRKGIGRSIKKIQCYNCGEFGHIQRDCSEPLKRKSKSSGPDCQAEMEEASVASVGAFGVTIGSVNHLWLVDSGAESHMTWKKELLQDFKELEPPVRLQVLDGQTMDAVGVGKVRMVMDLGSKKKAVTLNEVLYVPKLTQNLFSQ